MPRSLHFLALPLLLLPAISGTNPKGRRVKVDVRPGGRILRLDRDDNSAEASGLPSVPEEEEEEEVAAPSSRKAAPSTRLMRLETHHQLLFREKPGSGDFKPGSGILEPLRAAAAAAANSSEQEKANVSQAQESCRMPLPAEAIPENSSCPSQCPFWAEDGRKKSACFFKCVAALECGNPDSQVNLNHTMADEKEKICRSCRVSGCAVCTPKKDECQKCMDGYKLEGTECVSAFRGARYGVYAVVGVLVIYFSAYYIDLLCCRRAVNEEGVRQGLVLRSRAKLRQPKSSGAPAAAPPPASSPGPAPAGASAPSAPAAEPPPASSPGQAAPGGEERGGELERSAAEEGTSDEAAPPTRPLWPLRTCLPNSLCGGPGSALHMRYQIFVMIFATFTLILWVSLAASKDIRMFYVGWREVRTPRDLCKVVSEGHQLQKDTAQTKIIFLAVTYGVGVVASLAFAIHQYRCFEAMDDHSTMKDFAALIWGLPRLSGKEPQEELLRQLISRETGQELVGVSICWDYEKEEEKVMTALDWTIEEREAAEASAAAGAAAGAGQDGAGSGGGGEEAPPAERLASSSAASANAAPALRAAAAAAGAEEAPGQAPERRTSSAAAPAGAAASPVPNGAAAPEAAAPEAAAPEAAAPEAPASGWREKLFGGLDMIFLEPGPTEEAIAMKSQGAQAVKEIVHSMESTAFAFAVFKTEDARDTAVAALKEKGGVQYLGSLLHMRVVDAEPDTVKWKDFNKPKEKIAKRTVMGFFIVIFALVLWTVLIFLPSAIYQLSYSQSSEDGQPSGASSYVMMMVVVGGNQLMYLVCASVTDWIGFHFGDDREAAYMVLYMFSIMTMVALDMIVTFCVAYRVQVARGAHTYDGQLITELKSFGEILRSFPMQKALGNALWEYCFPATFLAGYVAEFCIVIVPYHLQRLILRSHAGIGGHRAERSMASWAVVDMSRYADVLVNLLLLALVFFVPGGYYLQTLLALIGSHIYIYLYDHWRFLRAAPGFYYAGRTIDTCAQYLLALPLGITLACLVLKANRARCDEGRLCLNGEVLFLLVVDAFFLHLALHWSAIRFLVPRIGALQHQRSELSFEQLASDVPASWFSTNPVHCLRSGSFYQHSPPCSFYVRGKEHLMQPNPKANSHFADRAAEPEAYD